MNRIKEIRTAKKMKQTELAGLVNVSQAALSGYETGKFEPDVDTLKKIARVLGTSIDHLLGNDEIADRAEREHPQGGVRIHVYAKIPAGIPLEAVDDIVDFEDIPYEMTKGGKEYIGFKVSGSSMYPKYIEGDTVIVLRQPECNSGQDCVVYVNGYDATLKKVVKQDNGIWLQPLNPAYEAVFYPYDGKDEIKVLGIVKQIRRDI